MCYIYMFNNFNNNVKVRNLLLLLLNVYSFLFVEMILYPCNERVQVSRFIKCFKKRLAYTPLLLHNCFRCHTVVYCIVSKYLVISSVILLYLPFGNTVENKVLYG